MGLIDYSKEPCSDIAFIDMKSFYASVECVKRGLHPLNTSLCVMSRADNSKGLILASSPTFKEVFGKKNVGRSRDLPFDITTRKFNYANAYRQNIKITKEYAVVYADSTYISVKRGTVGKEALHILIGITISGEKEILSYELFPTESPENYKDMLEDLKKRGLNRVLLFVTDGLKGIKEKLEDDEFISTIEDYLNNNFSKEETVLIHPMLVQKDYSETCWKDILDEELKENKEWQTMIENAEQKGISEITVHKSICLYKENESWHGKVYRESKFKELLQDITDNDYFLPTKREWEYLAGKGCRTIFPWGNNMDFSMKLRHIEFMDDDEEYSLEKENFFGLYIADDPYCREIVYDDGVFSYKGGDGGRNICGGMGPVWGYFPVSLYFEEKDEEIGEYINGGYDFFRRVIRIMKR